MLVRTADIISRSKAPAVAWPIISTSATAILEALEASVAMERAPDAAPREASQEITAPKQHRVVRKGKFKLHQIKCCILNL